MSGSTTGVLNLTQNAYGGDGGESDTAAAGAHTLGKAAGQGGSGSVVHIVLAASTSELERLYVLRRFGNHAYFKPLFWTQKTRPAREFVA